MVRVRIVADDLSGATGMLERCTRILHAGLAGENDKDTL